MIFYVFSLSQDSDFFLVFLTRVCYLFVYLSKKPQKSIATPRLLEFAEKNQKNILLSVWLLGRRDGAKSKISKKMVLTNGFGCITFVQKLNRNNKRLNTKPMNHQTVWEVAKSLATELGYHPTLPENLHRTLRHEGFPIAIIDHPKILSAEGERERRRVCRLLVKFLNKNEMDDAVRALSIATLAADAERFCARLSEEPHIFSVTLGEIAPVGEVLTLAGEVAVALSAEVESLECLI